MDKPDEGIPEEPTGQEESPEIQEPGQADTRPDRYKQLDEDIGKEPTEPTEEPKEPVEQPKDEKTDELEIVYEDDKITFKEGENVKELKKVDLGEGEYAFVPEGKEDGYLRQADYTRKTMALSDDRKKFEAEKGSIEKMRDEAFALRYVDELGGLTEEPLEKDYLKEDGKYRENFDNDEDAEKAYRTDKQKWGLATQLKTRQAEVQKENLGMIQEFIDEFGQETYEKDSAKLTEYLNPFVFKEIQPYPKDALKVLHKGLNYDADIAQAKKDAKAEALKEFNGKSKEGKKIILKSNHTPTTEDTMKNVPERYRELLTAVKQ